MKDVEAELKQTLAALVAVDSTSSRPNGPMLDLLEPGLVAEGFVCRRQTYVDDAGVSKQNLLAVPATWKEAEGVAELALVGHTDCVPFDPAWTEALTLTERDGKLYGRGACDTKAFIACALVAVRRTRAASLAKPVMLLFTADEEVGCVGAKKLVDARIGRARYAIVGEPTSLTPIRAHKGYCLAEVELVGREGHSAYPDSGPSAIFRAGRFLQKLEVLAQGRLREEVDLQFEPAFTSVNVGLIQGGKAKNIIAGSCRLTVEWRPIPRQSTRHVVDCLEQIVRELAVEEPGFEARLRVLRLDGGVDTALTSPLVQFLERASGKAPATVSFGTEAPQLTALGAEAVVFGPGNIQVAHRTGEFVPVEELVACEAVLERALLHFAGA